MTEQGLVVRPAHLTVAPERNGPIQHLFAGSDVGGQHWAVMASLVETCKLDVVEPQAYLADVLTRLVNHPQQPHR